MNWLVLAGSLGAILALAGIARLLRLGRDGKVEDAGAAAQAAEDALARFRAEGALVSDDDLAAIAAGDDGHVAVVKCHGVNAAVRQGRWSAVRAPREGIEVETVVRAFGLQNLEGCTGLEGLRNVGLLTH